ncbi:hypothetical protein ACMAZF_16570 [Psychrobium sp. nBUS_13]|uniref:hypothetical protein n=1 Tax=Psychrobium sp. nBUS_13 TaxID=3395319 RepID=UPI003EB8B0AE
MTNKNINLLALSTVLVATLSISNNSQAATTDAAESNILGQKKLTQKITKKSDEKLTQLMSSMTSQFEQQLSQTISIKFNL